MCFYLLGYATPFGASLARGEENQKRFTEESFWLAEVLKFYKEKEKGRAFWALLVFYPAIFLRIRTMLAIAAIAAIRASTIATMMSGERPAVVDLVLLTSDCTVPNVDCMEFAVVCKVPMLVCIVPKSVLIVAVSPEMLVIVPVIVPKSVLIVAVSPEMLVTVAPIEASDVVIVPSEVVMFTFCPATAPKTALRSLRLVFIVPTLVCTVANPLLMLVTVPVMPEILLLRPETDEDTPWMLVFIVPMDVLSVATFPFIAITVAFRA